MLIMLARCIGWKTYLRQLLCQWTLWVKMEPSFVAFPLVTVAVLPGFIWVEEHSELQGYFMQQEMSYAKANTVSNTLYLWGKMPSKKQLFCLWTLWVIMEPNFVLFFNVIAIKPCLMCSSLCVLDCVTGINQIHVETPSPNSVLEV